MEIQLLTEKYKRLLTALARCKDAYEKKPLYFSFESIISQLEYLLALEEGKTQDLTKLKSIKIGWIAVRELDGYEDQELIELLCLISVESEITLKERGNSNGAE